MKIKACLALICFILLAGTPVLADEGGAKDTVDMVITVMPDSALGQLDVQLELWVFDDDDTLNGASMGFGWDNPKMQMTGATAGPGASGFADPVFFDNNDVDWANANQLFCFVGIRLFTPGVWPNPTRQLWATYNIKLFPNVWNGICYKKLGNVFLL